MKYFFIFILISNGLFAQVQKAFPYRNDDLSGKIINFDTFYEGKVEKEKIFKIKFEFVKKNLQKPERYSVIGVVDFNKTITKFEGEIIFKEVFGVRNYPEEVLIFGDFNFNEKKDDKITGDFKGKIRIQTEKDINKFESGATVTFKGELKEDETEIYQIWFGNFNHNDIDKVIFR
ncbi:hypothetical protein [Halpernia sp.]|uniref:hypothetical protein n=1 Tax=Halpernia sp. TaxID=2782209 RepID=UPI003A93A844